MLESDAAIARRVRAVQEQIAAACGRTGRSPEAVTLIAVTKRVEAARVAAAFAAGVRAIGENLVQEAVQKFAAPEWPAAVERHLIGHLQTNKAAAAVAAFGAIHSVDSPRSARAIARAVEQQGRSPYAVFLQVNVGGEATKFGVPPDELSDLARQCRELALEVQGVMAVPPPVADP
ncbi:MAG TPA: alanine racemase, partial [Limnochordia bacterium]|nr:alanine racemase [Limnochordia bacterium]